MATGNKKSTSGKRKAQTSRKGSTGRKKKTAAQQQEDFTREVILWIIVAVSILLFISNFGIGGTIGNAVSRFFFGVMGLIAYVFPVLLLVGTFFAVSNRGNRVATVKLVAMILFDLFLCMLIELLTKGSAVDGAAAAYNYSFEHRTGGGFIGGLLAWIFCPNFGLAGSYVIDAIMLIISLVLITERSALRGMQKGGKKVYESARSGNERHKERVRIQREEREQRREEQALRRMDRKVEGVAIDTRVLPRQNVIEHSDEISELNAEDYLEMPEVREEKIVPLTSDGGYPPVPGICLIATAVLLLIADHCKDGDKLPKNVTYTDAFSVGIAQGIATLPGLSRSGTTITACLLAGYQRNFAVKYSFLMSIPAILGALVLELKDATDLAVSGTEVVYYVIGMAVAAVVGYICIKTMLVIVRKKKFTVFAIYCLLVGALSIGGYFYLA